MPYIRFHNKLVIYYSLCLLIVSYIFAFIATNYAKQLNTTRQLQQDRDALITVCNYYDRKHDEFLDLILPLYIDKNNRGILSELLESETDQDYETDPFKKQEVVNMLEGISSLDSDIVAIMIYKNLTGATFVYTCGSRTFNTIGPDYIFYDQLREKPLGRTIWGTRALPDANPSIWVYGIAGTLGTWSIFLDAGRFAILYRTDAISKRLSDVFRQDERQAAAHIKRRRHHL